MTLFITGTDTDCGKTTVTGLLARYLQEHETTVVTQKWIQSGSPDIAQDVHRHYEIMKINPESYAPYSKAICPYIFSLPASAHLAAEQAGVVVDPNRLLVSYSALTKQFDIVLVEGSGGIMVPISRSTTTADVLHNTPMPTLLVIKNTLGCINHALLTLSFLAEHKLPVLGTIFTRTESGDSILQDDNPRIISELSGVRCFGELPFDTNIDSLYQNSLGIWDSISQSINSSR